MNEAQDFLTGSTLKDQTKALFCGIFFWAMLFQRENGTDTLSPFKELNCYLILNLVVIVYTTTQQPFSNEPHANFS